MRTALADKALNVRLLNCGAPERVGQGGREKRQGEESVRGHDSVATLDVN